MVAELLPKKGYLNDYKGNYAFVEEVAGGCMPVMVYRCLYNDVYDWERYIAVHSFFGTLITGKNLDAVRSEIERRNKSGKW